VAQLVARSVRDAEVEGSSPFTPTKELLFTYHSKIDYSRTFLTYLIQKTKYFVLNTVVITAPSFAITA
jgi:hypothetical protein